MRRPRSGRLRRHFAAGLALLALLFALAWVVRTVPFGRYAFRPDPSAAAAGVGGVPLDPTSPWPKFRANALQNGRSAVAPMVDPSRRPWRFQTGKGVFSSPVIDAAGTTYIGSADHVFRAIDRDGRLLWQFRTQEVIDSSALLDDRGRVYFGSGDAHLYALDRDSGALVWAFRADPVEVVEERYGIESFNVDWFEGNVAMLPDGTLIAPNDNFLIYAVDRDTGVKTREYLGNELMWSLPAVNPDTGRMFAGSQFMLWRNVFAWDTHTGERLWARGGWGSNAASPLLTSADPRGAVVLGGFDGYVRAFAQDSGKQLWKRGLRGHVYGSPAQLSDGTLIQPATDGTIYALEPETGEVTWAHDTRSAIRSSPAVDAHDRIYVGSGDGELLSLDRDGTLRWSYRCIDAARNDLNGSPALGPDGITVAGEDGSVCHVPWDYPLTPAGRLDPRVTPGPGERLPVAGAFLVPTSPLGGLHLDPPAEIAANQPLGFTLLVREDGDTKYAALDPEHLTVVVSGAPPMRTEVSADRQFLTLVPEAAWVGPEGGSLRVAVRGDHRSDPWRLGLKFFGGRRAGSFEQEFRFEVAPHAAGSAPFSVPRAIGDPASVFEFSRLAAPNPTMLPSWNQIGFDSLHYLASPVEGDERRALVWVIAGRLVDGRTVVDTSQTLRFPLVLDHDGGLLTFRNEDGFKINFVGSWDMPFGFYRASVRLDPVTGEALESAALVAVAHCNELEYYGRFLQLMGMADLRTGHMLVYGGLEIGLHDEAPPPSPGAVGTVTFSRDARSVTAHVAGGRLAEGEHVFSLMLVDAATANPLPLYYTKRTHVSRDAAGHVVAVRVELDASEDGELPPSLRAYYLVDTHVVARAELPGRMGGER